MARGNFLVCWHIFSFLMPLVVFASATDGVIDTTNKFAWGDNLAG